MRAGLRSRIWLSDFKASLFNESWNTICDQGHARRPRRLYCTFQNQRDGDLDVSARNGRSAVPDARFVTYHTPNHAAMYALYKQSALYPWRSYITSDNRETRPQ